MTPRLNSGADSLPRLAVLLAVFAIAVLMVFALTALAQSSASITVGENVRVSPDSLGLPLTEPYMVAHPKNPRWLLAAAILASPTLGGSRIDQPCVSFLSQDGGLTWSVPHRFAIKSCADPWLGARDDGTALFVGLEGGQVQVFRSSDGGQTWGSAPAASFGTAHDTPTIAVDRSAGSSGSFYLLSIEAGRSATGRDIVRLHLVRTADGTTFDEPVKIQPSNLNFNNSNPVVLSDGTLVISFGDFMSNVDDFHGKGRLERARFWILVSKDGGKTFTPPLFVAEGIYGLMTADQSGGQFRDRLYVVAPDGKHTRIEAFYSTDRGERWTGPILVSTRKVDVEFRQTLATAVNGDGVVGVSWIERRRGSRCQDAYFATSVDGGQSFLPEVRLSTAESCPHTPGNGRAAERWTAGGDYIGLAASADGDFHALWSDSRNGIFELYTAAVKVRSPASTHPK